MVTILGNGHVEGVALSDDSLSTWTKFKALAAVWRRQPAE